MIMLLSGGSNTRHRRSRHRHTGDLNEGVQPGSPSKTSTMYCGVQRAHCLLCCLTQLRSVMSDLEDQHTPGLSPVRTGWRQNPD